MFARIRDFRDFPFQMYFSWRNVHYLDGGINGNGRKIFVILQVVSRHARFVITRVNAAFLSWRTFAVICADFDAGPSKGIVKCLWANTTFGKFFFHAGFVALKHNDSCNFIFRFLCFVAFSYFLISVAFFWFYAPYHYYQNRSRRRRNVWLAAHPRISHFQTDSASPADFDWQTFPKIKSKGRISISFDIFPPFSRGPQHLLLSCWLPVRHFKLR